MLLRLKTKEEVFTRQELMDNNLKNFFNYFT